MYVPLLCGRSSRIFISGYPKDFFSIILPDSFNNQVEEPDSMLVVSPYCQKPLLVSKVSLTDGIIANVFVILIFPNATVKLDVFIDVLYFVI